MAQLRHMQRINGRTGADTITELVYANRIIAVLNEAAARLGEQSLRPILDTVEASITGSIRGDVDEGQGVTD